MAATMGCGKKLLALDDNPDSAELVSRVAIRAGYDTRCLSDPRSLPQVLNEWAPDVLTLDLCMPEDDGINILSVLEKLGFTGKLLIISGQDDWMRKSAVRLAQARGLNVADDLPKPLDLKVLRDIVTRI